MSKNLVAALALMGLAAISLVILFLTPSRRPPVAPTKAIPLKRTFSDKSCQDAYQKLFSKDQLEIRMVFGYKDARPARFVTDRYEQMLFIQKITSACSGERQDCDFHLEAGNEEAEQESFYKTLTGPNGELKKIKLVVTHSSVSPDDESNRQNPFQAWQSQSAQEFFEQGLKQADIVFYNGHSRSGGGPDFEPPKIDKKNHVNYLWYKEHQPGLEALEKALSISAQPEPKILGLFSCASEQLFTRRLQAKNPELGIIGSQQLLYFSDALENSLNALSVILEMKCRREFGGTLSSSMELQGFLPALKAASRRTSP